MQDKITKECEECGKEFTYVPKGPYKRKSACGPICARELSKKIFKCTLGRFRTNK